MIDWNRRHLMLGGVGMLVGCAHSSVTASASALRQIEMEIGGRVGVAALDTGSGKSVSYRANERLALDDNISYSKADLLSFSPVTSAHITEGALSIEALCAAAVTVSDNAAANLLLAKIGGPAALTAYLRRCGDQDTRLDRTEMDLNTNLPDDPRDTTTPRRDGADHAAFTRR